MDREILFRAVSKLNGNWVYGSYVKPLETIQDEFQDFDIYIETLGQFIGLKDKNGTKIFEGDIVKVYSDCDGYYAKKQYLNGVILFDEEYFFEYKISFNHIRYCCEENIGNHRDNIEVIGNIYDNPELLEGL